MSFLIPIFSSKTITDLTSQTDEESALAKNEVDLKARFAEIRDYMKDSAPLGVPRQPERGPDETEQETGSLTGTQVSEGSQDGAFIDEAEDN